MLKDYQKQLTRQQRGSTAVSLHSVSFGFSIVILNNLGDNTGTL